MALPTASTPGYDEWRGFVGCVDVIRFLQTAERLGLAMGLIREELDVIQLTGDADASKGVHSLGSAYDVRQRSAAWVRIFREMGSAFWPREDGDWAATDNEHGHGIITCPHDDRSAYQMTAYKRGYSGLGQGPSGSPYAGMWGYGSKDAYWRPATIRTTTQGLAWAESQIDILEGDIMGVTADELRRLIREELAGLPKATWQYPLVNRRTKEPWSAGSYVEGGALLAGDAARLSAYLAAEPEPDIDEVALAAALGPVVRQAVIEAGQPAAVAEAVVAQLAAALTPAPAQEAGA